MNIDFALRSAIPFEIKFPSRERNELEDERQREAECQRVGQKWKVSPSNLRTEADEPEDLKIGLKITRNTERSITFQFLSIVFYHFVSYKK